MGRLFCCFIIEGEYKIELGKGKFFFFGVGDGEKKVEKKEEGERKCRM